MQKWKLDSGLLLLCNWILTLLLFFSFIFQVDEKALMIFVNSVLRNWDVSLRYEGKEKLKLNWNRVILDLYLNLNLKLKWFDPKDALLRGKKIKIK